MLTFQAQSLGLLDASKRGRGRAGRVLSRGITRGHSRGRGIVSRSAAVLDKRPKQLVVQGFTAEEEDVVKQRFKVQIVCTTLTLPVDDTACTAQTIYSRLPYCEITLNLFVSIYSFCAFVKAFLLHSLKSF